MADYEIQAVEDLEAELQQSTSYGSGGEPGFLVRNFLASEESSQLLVFDIEDPSKHKKRTNLHTGIRQFIEKEELTEQCLVRKNTPKTLLLVNLELVSDEVREQLLPA